MARRSPPPGEEYESAKTDEVDPASLRLREPLIPGVRLVSTLETDHEIPAAFSDSVIDTLKDAPPERTLLSPAVNLPEPRPSEPARPSDAAELSISTVQELPAELPIKGWARYEILDPIGEGAAGRVYKARDRTLKRMVALKFLRGAPSKRFVQEAQAQARVQHENICKVFEVGEVQGFKYIAMQLVEGGKTSTTAREEMSLEQKLRVIADVAHALHAAHQIGLIHRDIKPGNILIERTESGAFRPYVTDFGLARELDAAGGSVAGGVLGTPAYMAPEQARGERLDRRADVYSLGAALFYLLSGHAPIEGPNAIEMLLAVMDGRLVPLRSVAPDLPVDLELVVSRALAVEPEKRYESARAFAEDIERYLAGDPVQAHPQTWRYVASKLARKHKRLVIVSAIGIFAALAMGAVGIHAQWTARERARLARQFGADVDQINHILRYAHLLPLHDTGRELTLIEQRMKEIERVMRGIGGAAEGPGHYALGRGYLALKDREKARAHLELAWNAEYRDPEVSYAFGQLLGGMYIDALDEVRQIGDSELRQARLDEIQDAYRSPALQYLKASRAGHTDSTTYVEGLVALYEERHAEALGKAKAAYLELPWLYEAHRLEGDAHVAVGRTKHDAGDWEGALKEYELAGSSYRQAIDIARSDPAVYAAECGRLILVLEVEAIRGGDVGSAYEKALGACDQALAAHPESAEARRKKSLAYWRWGGVQRARGEDPRPSLVHAVDEAASALERAPKDLDAQRAIGQAHLAIADYEIERGLDPRPALEKAIASAKGCLSVNAYFADAYNTIGSAYTLRGRYEMTTGEDPRSSLMLAVENFAKSIELNPKLATAHTNAGDPFLLIAKHELGQGHDPRSWIGRAIESYSRAAKINAKHPETNDRLGLAAMMKADHALATGVDPEPFLAEALASLDLAVASNKRFAQGWRNMSAALRRKALIQLEKGEDPRELLARAGSALDEAERLNASDLETALERVRFAMAVVRRGLRFTEVAPNLGAAEEVLLGGDKAARLAQELNPRSSEAHRLTGELARWRAEVTAGAGAPEIARQSIKDGLASVGAALAIDPASAESLVVEGTLWIISARLESAGEKRKELGHRALDVLDRALKKNSMLERLVRPDLGEARELATPPVD